VTLTPEETSFGQQEPASRDADPSQGPTVSFERKGRTGSSGARAGGNWDGILQPKVCWVHTEDESKRRNANSGWRRE